MGDYDAHAGEHVTYFVPDDTLLSATATDLGIRTDQDLFGGVVPFAFVPGFNAETGSFTRGVQVYAARMYCVCLLLNGTNVRTGAFVSQRPCEP